MSEYTDEDRRAWLEENYGSMPEFEALCAQAADVIDRMMRDDDDS